MPPETMLPLILVLKGIVETWKSEGYTVRGEVGAWELVGPDGNACPLKDALIVSLTAVVAAGMLRPSHAH